MQHNECAFISDQFSDYLENTLSSDVRSKVDSHLSICPACQKVYQELSQVLSSLHKLPTQKTTGDFTERLMTRIEQDGRDGWTIFSSKGVGRVAGYAVAAGLVVALGMNVWFDPVRSVSPGSRIEVAEKSAPAAADNGSLVNADTTMDSAIDSLDRSRGTIQSNAGNMQLVSGPK